MSLQVQQIQKHLDDHYVPTVSLDDVSETTPEAQCADLLKTRALAALAVNMLTDSGPECATASVTDGYKDHGIDAICYSESERCLYLIQSKFSWKGSGSISTGDLHKFFAGVETLIQGRFEEFNQRIHARHQELLNVLLDPQNRFYLVTVYTGTQPLSDDCKEIVSSFLDKNNEISEQFFFEPINVKDIYSFISAGAGKKPINLELALYNWGYIESPIRSFFGQVSGTDLANWYAESGPHLFSPNIRVYLGNTDANEGIASSVVESPEYFWYFNNGITVLVSSIEKKPIGGDSRDVGYFACSNVMVVNGAQTVGTLHSMRGRYSENLSHSRVWIRIIQIDQEDEETARLITRTNNTQNRIEKRDFVALDPEQKRIHDELALNDVSYLYKSGETSGEGIDSFDLTVATVARACRQSDLQYAVQAKREISKLWDDIEKPPYKKLFHSGINGDQLHREVQVLRSVDQFARTRKRSVSDREKLLLTHGNRFLLFLVFRSIGEDVYKEEYNGRDLESLFDSQYAKLRDAVQASYPDAYLGSLVKNLKKCREVLEAIDNG